MSDLDLHDRDREEFDTPNPRKIYIGNLPGDSTDEEIRRDFRRFGRIVSVESKGKFAFVEYDDERDADEAVQAMNGRRCLGERIQVQHHNPGARTAKGPPAHQVVPPPPRSRGPKPTGKEQRTEYRLLVFNLDDRVSWQDLKDFGRNAGDVNFANVFTRSGYKVGVIEYFDLSTMEKAVDKLQRMRLYERRVRVEEDRGQLDEDGPAAAAYLSRMRRGGESSRSRSRDRAPHHPAPGYHRRDRDDATPPTGSDFSGSRYQKMQSPNRYPRGPRDGTRRAEESSSRHGLPESPHSAYRPSSNSSSYRQREWYGDEREREVRDYGRPRGGDGGGRRYPPSDGSPYGRHRSFCHQ